MKKAFRILYVEDNEALRETIGMLMEGDDREILLAAEAEAALAICAAEPVDLVLTDVGLPGLSGTALAERLLADDPAQWVVLCSGRDVARPAGSGPNVRTLLKPFDFDVLEALIVEATAKRRR